MPRYTVGVRDLDQDGKNEVLVGTQNYELHLYDAAWRELARARRAVLQGSIDFLTADADRDGKLEIFATDHYGRLQAFRHDGSKAAAFYTSIGEIDSDGSAEIVVASQTGCLYVLDGAGRVRWQDRAGTDVVEALVLRDQEARLAYFDHSARVPGERPAKPRFPDARHDSAIRASPFFQPTGNSPQNQPRSKRRTECHSAPQARIARKTTAGRRFL